jgi:hypothetical protein
MTLTIGLQVHILPSYVAVSTTDLNLHCRSRYIGFSVELCFQTARHKALLTIGTMANRHLATLRQFLPWIFCSFSSFSCLVFSPWCQIVVKELGNHFGQGIHLCSEVKN